MIVGLRVGSEKLAQSTNHCCAPLFRARASTAQYRDFATIQLGGAMNSDREAADQGNGVANDAANSG